MWVRLAWRNLWRNRLRTMIMLSAMSLGMVGVLLMTGFITGMYGSMVANAISWQLGNLQIHNAAFLEEAELQATLVNPQQITDYLDASPVVQAWSGRFVVSGMLASARSTRGIRVNGVVPDREAALTPIATHIVAGAWLDDAGRNPVVLSQKTANRLDLRIGSKVILTFSDNAGEVTGAAFRVRGIYQSPSSALDDTQLFVRRSDLVKLADWVGIHEIVIRVVGDSETATQNTLVVQADVREIKDASTSVRDWQTVQPMIAAILNQAGSASGVMVLIYVLAMAFGIVNIMLMSVMERTREFGVLMAIGMNKRGIMLMVLAESTWLGICGAVLGVFLSALIVLWLGQAGIPLGDMAEGLGAWGIDTMVYPSVALEEYVGTALVVLLACIIAAIYPARTIIKRTPVEAMAQKI